MLNRNDYDIFVRQGRNVMFTDDQIDFLAYWLEISDGTDNQHTMLNRKEIERMKSEVGGIVCQCGNPIYIDRINDYWIKFLPIRVLEELKDSLGNVVVWEIDILDYSDSKTSNGSTKLDVLSKTDVMDLIDQHLARYRLNEKE